MKLSKETIDILHNFRTINPSIVLREGDVIMTQRRDMIVAKAKVAETFPRTIPLVDLKKFLSLFTLGGDGADVDFGEKSIKIIHGNSHSLLAYSPEALIDSPPPGKTPRIKNKYVQFTLNKEAWDKVSSAMSIMSFTEFAFVGDGRKLSIQGLSTRIENGTSDTFSEHIGNTDKNFHCIMNSANMRLIPANYDVSIDKAGLVHFKGDVAEYWLIFSTKSYFED